MAKPNALRALGPFWMRFTDPDDAGKYGDGWFCYAEGVILRKPARELIALENGLGMPLPSVMNGLRENTVLGETAAAWIALREVDPARAGDFDEFNPIVMMIEWSRTNPEPVPKDVPPEPTPEPVANDSATPEPSPYTTSDQTVTVALPNLPIAES